jgi:hypothetical protein
MTHELHRLLGVSDDTDVDRLRRAYEEQMSAAARSHDHTRALALSSALDDLPSGLRSALYPRMTTRTASYEPVVTTRSPIGRISRTRRSRPLSSSRPQSSPRPQSSSRSAGRVLLTLVGVIAVVLAIAYWQQHRDNALSTGPQYQPPQGPPPAYYAQVATRDAHRVVNTIRHCDEQGGSLPTATPATTGHAAFNCASHTFNVAVAPFDRVSYLQTGPRTYRVIITSEKGPAVTYDSATDRFSS